MFIKGWRIEYTAACDAYTACPQEFAEFYNQRKRWDTSILANIWTILTDSRRFIQNNHNMSIFYIWFQGVKFILMVLGPGCIFINLVIAVEMILEIDNSTSFIINLIPLILFIVVCFFAKEDVQIKCALILSICKSVF